MLSPSDLKTGTAIEWRGEPYQVIAYEHGKVAMSGRTKLRNLLSGNVIEETFRPAQQLAEANLERRAATFLYQQNDTLFFMDSETFDQYEIPAKNLGTSANFLKEGQPVTLIKFKGKAINADIPIKVDLKVVETSPGIKGDTAAGGQKKAKLETGATISVPLFVNEGDLVRVNTQEGIYVGRIKP